ncbi:MAG: NUDIX domain-containing protein [Alphaproteobacteria bacterium]|nr:NUDIX domain-containing protein [Alphaproteobacteria bacterium]
MVKLPDWIYRQSAILPYRGQGDDLAVLIITSRKGTRWVLPKGIVEPGMTAAASAAKEAMEEAGVEGRVFAHSLGTYSYPKWGGTCTVEVFPMKVATERKTWPESGFRRRKWVSLKQARKRLEGDELRSLLRRLPDALKQEAKGGRASGEIGKTPRVLYLLRHAKSSWDQPELADFDRPLAPRGRRACKTMRRYMRFADLRPDLVLCSPSARTRATLKKALPEFEDDVRIEYEPSLYEAEAGDLIDRLRRVPNQVSSVLIIAHNPGMQDLAISLAGAGDPEALARLKAKFPTAGLATLVLKRDRWRELARQTCDLHSFVVPRDFDPSPDEPDLV